jgi:RimJ/RimL family protein N-acetyltransferase
MTATPQGLDACPAQAVLRLRHAHTLFTSARLKIRELDLEDAEPLRQMHADPRVTALLIDDSGVPLSSLANATLFIRSAQQLYLRYPGYGIWALESSACAFGSGEDQIAVERPGGFCGFMALMPVDELPGDVEIGIRLKPSLWGAGVSFEATRLVLAYGFDTLGLHEIMAFCDPRNRSARLNNEAQGADWICDAVHQGKLASRYVLTRKVFEITRHESRQQRMRAVLRAAGRGV